MKPQLRKHLWFSRMGFALSLGVLFLPTGCDPSTSATPSAFSSSAPSSVSVAIVPSTATVPEGGSLSFLATVKGMANTTVTWSVQEGKTGGSITSSGLYTAPNTVGTYHVVATSVADATAGASAVVTIVEPPVTSTAVVNFTAVGSMTVPRAGSTATLLQDGRVLIVGGGQSGPTAELYSPPTGTFQASSANIVGTLVLLNNGDLLDTGSAQLYHPETDSTTPTGHLLVNQVIYAATMLGNGKALVLGPQDAEIYDPAIGSFASAGPYASTLGNLLTTAITLADGRVLVLGSDPPQLFDPATNSFSTTGSLSATGLYGMDLYSATLLKDGRVLVVGGMGDWRTAAAVLYDPKTGTFTTTGSMNDARDAHAAVLLADGHVLILGGDGWACSGTVCYFSGSLSSAELYDPATGTFSRAGYMNIARTLPTATLLQNGDVLVTGGYLYCGIGCFNGSTATAEIYHPQ
jgi:large repetitive protein